MARAGVGTYGPLALEIKEAMVVGALVALSSSGISGVSLPSPCQLF